MYWLLSSDKFSNPIDPLINCKLTSYCFYNHRVEQSFTDLRPILTLQDTREQSLGSRSRNPSWMTRVFLVARAILTRIYTCFFCTMFIRFIFLIQTTWYSLGHFPFWISWFMRTFPRVQSPWVSTRGLGKTNVSKL